jgi:hypothetical protein
MNDTITAPQSEHTALTWLVQNSPVTVASYRELGEVFSWDKTKTWKVIQKWKRKGWVETETAPDTGRTTVTVVPTAVPIAVPESVADDNGDGVPHSEREPSSPLPAAAEGRSQHRSGAQEPAAGTVYARPLWNYSGRGRTLVRRSWALTFIAYGFCATGIAINIWNARSTGGDWLDMGIPVALGVLAEAALFFLPARLLTLPPARKALAITLYAFVMIFAVVNSLRMASLIAADQAAVRADRQTAGVQAAARSLNDARASRDRACRAGQGKSAACRASQEDVAKLEKAQASASAKVEAAASRRTLTSRPS